MSTPRSQLVDETNTPWYHCVSRCVRRARLCGDHCAHRNDWIVARLRELVESFVIHCGGFAVMDNHSTCSCGPIRHEPERGPTRTSHCGGW